MSQGTSEPARLGAACHRCFGQAVGHVDAVDGR